MTRDRTNWIETFQGNQFWPLDPKREEIELRDVAHALSMLCRFAGHCLHFYSVAEHSIHASRLVPQEWAKEALLHDAAEAYINDICSPIKHHFGGYDEAEAAIEAAVIERFGLKPKPWPEIKAVDMRLVITERTFNWSGPMKFPWSDTVDPYLSLELLYWSPIAAEFHFLERAKQLGLK